jgi:hypothetical protein
MQEVTGSTPVFSTWKLNPGIIDQQWFQGFFMPGMFVPFLGKCLPFGPSKCHFGYRMGIKKKTPKGEISVENFKGRIRLRWRYAGERYNLTLSYLYSLENLAPAHIKVAEIKLDMMKGCFDPSLEKYKQETVKKPVKIKPERNVQEVKKEIKGVFLHELVAKFNEWGNHIKNIDVENSWDYLYVRKLLEKCMPPATSRGHPVIQEICRELGPWEENQEEIGPKASGIS